jgi:hypothetical protein
MYTVQNVKPHYKATAYVQLIPPPEASITKDIKKLRNPWLDLGLGALNTAATYATVDRKFLDQLKSGGLSDSVVITNGYPAPIATIEVIAPSQGMATSTTDQVVKRFNDVVKSLQDDYAVQTPGRILTRRLDTGNNLEETGGKVKRALVAVVGAGALITAGLTIAFDALMRRRSRRKSDAAEAGGERSIPETAASTAPAPGERTVKLQAQNDVNRSRAAASVNGSGNGQSKSADATIVLPSGLYQPGEGRAGKR